MNIGDILANSLSADQGLREAATAQLEAAVSSNFDAYLVALVQELANESAQAHIRSAAGVALKNTLIAKEADRKAEYARRWLSADKQSTETVKQGALMTLRTASPQAATQAAQVIAAIAEVELPLNTWPDLIAHLLNNMNTAGDNANLKITTLQTIGFSPEALTAQSSQILTAVITGATKEEQNQEVRLAALNALYNSLEFIRENFSREAERSYIMMVVCEATQSVDSRVQVSAFECLVRIMTFYYGFMGVYMEKALYALTVNGMKHDNENVALQAIEFWSTVCELENDYEYESQMAEEEGADVEQQPLGFAKAALSEIVPVLLTLMTSQEEDVDEDEWNVAMAAATCLSLLAQCVQDNIVALVLPFVQTNIRNPDWRYREAAVMAFGSIMEGPNPQLLAPLATQAMPILLEMIRDPVVQVKDTTAWTLGQISENLLAYINLEAQLQSLVTALLAGLSDSPKITSNCCWALMNIGRGLNPDEQHDLATYPLSPFFEGICKELVTICNKDNNEANSRTSAFEALATIIAHCPLDVLQIVSAIAISMLERLELTINVQNQIVGMDEMNQHLELQSNICNAITSITRRLGRSIAPVADRIMQVFLQLMSVSGRHATTLEDAFLAIGAVIAALETDFFRYMEAFKNFLYAALQNHEEHQLCLIAIGLIGDICRSLGLQALPYCDEFFTLLLADLSSEKLHRSVKPAIFECFGDIVLAIGGSFEKYAPTVLPIIFSACQIQVNDAMSADELDYLVSLREGIVEGFVGIVQGLKTDAKVGMLEPYLPQLFQFLEFAIADEDIVSTDLLMNEAGLLGDLAEAFPNGQLRTLLQRDWIVNLLRSARTNRHATVSQREVSRWAREMVKRAMK